MRQIKFRGKDIETGKWMYGGLIQRMGLQNVPEYEDGRFPYFQMERN